MTIAQNTFTMCANGGFIAIFKVTEPQHHLLILSELQNSFAGGAIRTSIYASGLDECTTYILLVFTAS
jgi:hypothetical protein